jgi:hypothetical protein
MSSPTVQVIPFVDMTVKGWVWYQGENNMGNLKGSSMENLGYSCEQRELIRGWRDVWSETPGTTDPNAPFGVVTLASSGAEGNDAAMGAMRIAQTAGSCVVFSFIIFLRIFLPHFFCHKRSQGHTQNGRIIQTAPTFVRFFFNSRYYAGTHSDA